MSKDIERLATSYYMVVVNDSTTESQREEVTRFCEGHHTIDITVRHTPEEVRGIVEDNIYEDDPLIVVHKFGEMNEDMQLFLSQYLKGIAEQYTDVPIIVFNSSEKDGLTMSNPDLSGRVYSL